jgi:hypothetical protein
MSGYPPLYLDDVLKFGKHKGKTMRETIEHYPMYVQWAVDEGIIELANDAYELYAKIIERG